MTRLGWLCVVMVGSLGLLLLLNLQGCNRAPRRIAVAGTVTVDGKPMDGGVLNYEPDTKKGNEHRIACVGPIRDGNYNLTTMGVWDSHTGPGIPLGWYKVYITTEDPKVAEKFHGRYGDPRQTPIFVEVTDNPPPGAYDIKMSKK